MASWTVAGAGGFIGSHVVEELRARGERVVAMDRAGADLSAAIAAGATPAQGDLGDPASLRRALEGSDVAVNATGLFDLGAPREQLARLNVAGARALAEAARSAGVRRLVHLSSVAVYGLPPRRPMDETGPYAPRNPYEETKLEGELAAAELHGQGLEVAILRPTLVYGPRSRYGQALFLAMFAQMRTFGGRRFPLLTGGPLSHHVHVRDVARAAILCGTHPEAAGRAFNAADRAPLGFGETLEALLSACGVARSPRLASPLLARFSASALAHLPDVALSAFNRRLRAGHEHLVARGLAPQLVPRLDRDWLSYFSGDFVYDTSRLAALGFRWQHPDFREAIGGVARWYEAEGWLPRPAEQAAP